MTIRQADQKGPIHVLDLCCGEVSKVPIELARRYPHREIHYFGIDRAGKQFANVDVGAHGNKISTKWFAKHLDFHNPENLSKQLQNLIGNHTFDEIHFHMPLYDEEVYVPAEFLPTGSLAPSVKRKFLTLFVQRLKPGGRFFHTFQEFTARFVPKFVLSRRKIVWNIPEARATLFSTRGRNQRRNTSISNFTSRHSLDSSYADYLLVVRKTIEKA